MTPPDPRFPEVQVSLRTRNRWAVASAIRQALRRAGKDRQEIDLFLAEALASEDAHELEATCGRWVRLKPLPQA
ncbi:MAG: hypothetical protein ABI639_04470 [Thermoanaerobaculia bacterium]